MLIKIMFKSHTLIRSVVIAFLCIFLTSGCALYNKIFGTSVEKTAEELMTEGSEKFERGNYEAAAEAFQALKDRYPYSDLAIQAELKIADSLFNSKEYQAAFDAYDEFERLHPRDKNIPYAIYQKGMCNFKRIKGVDTDQSPTLKAKEEFERLIKRFPKDSYAGKARKNLRECLITLAEYELYVGHFYYKMGKYQAAMARYKYIIENYPDMGQYHEALEYLSKCKDKLSKEAM